MLVHEHKPRDSRDGEQDEMKEKVHHDLPIRQDHILDRMLPRLQQKRKASSRLQERSGEDQEHEHDMNQDPRERSTIRQVPPPPLTKNTICVLGPRGHPHEHAHEDETDDELRRPQDQGIQKVRNACTDRVERYEHGQEQGNDANMRG